MSDEAPWRKPVADRVRGPMEIRDRPVRAAFEEAVKQAEYESSAERRIDDLTEELAEMTRQRNEYRLQYNALREDLVALLGLEDR